jgi:hypothetical protein
VRLRDFRERTRPANAQGGPQGDQRARGARPKRPEGSTRPWPGCLFSRARATGLRSSIFHLPTIFTDRIITSRSGYTVMFAISGAERDGGLADARGSRGRPANRGPGGIHDLRMRRGRRIMDQTDCSSRAAPPHRQPYSRFIPGERREAGRRRATQGDDAMAPGLLVRRERAGCPTGTKPSPEPVGYALSLFFVIFSPPSSELDP